MLAPDSTVTSEGGYLLSAYRLKRWLQPAAFYSLLYPNHALREGRQNVQHDLAGTLRFDVNEHWIIKLEGHYMHGTASLAGSPDARAAMPANWGLFVFKTTAYFWVAVVPGSAICGDIQKNEPFAETVHKMGASCGAS